MVRETITIRGIHIVEILGTNQMNIMRCPLSLVRSESQFCLLQNKSRYCIGQQNRVLESVNGGMIRVTTSDLPHTNGHDDPFSNGGRAHGLELDIVGVPQVDNGLLQVANQHLANLLSSDPMLTDLSGLHFTGTELQT